MLETSSGYGGPPGFGQPPGGPGAPAGGYGPPPGSPPGGYGPPPGGGFTPPPAPGGYPGAGAPGGGPPGAWSATEALGYGWSALTKDFGNTALPLVVGFFVMGIPSGIISGLRGAIVGGMASSGNMDMQTIQLINLGSTPIVMLVNAVAQAFMLGGLVSFALKAARGQKPEFGEVFSGGRFFMPMLGAALVQTVGVTFGMMLCLIPGIFLALAWAFYPVMVVDRGCGAMAALGESWRMSEGQKVNLLLLGVLLFLAAIVGMLACCVGLFVVGPLGIMALAFVYMRLNGEEPRPFGMG